MDLLKNLMTYTDKFVYPSQSDEIELYTKFADRFSKDIKESICRQYVQSDRDNPIIRLSGLGKTPAFELLAKKLGVIKQNTASNVREGNRLIFALGDYFEAWLRFTLERIGYKIVGEQDEVNWNGVKGHIDFIIEDERGERSLIECKSANDYYFERVTKFGVGDDRGYLTQLLTYQDCLQIPAYWIFFNKNNCKMSIIPLDSIDEEYRTIRLRRARNVVKAFNECKELKDLYTLVKPVPPSIEKKRDGSFVLDSEGNPKLYAPSDVNHPEIMYIMEEGKTDYRKSRMYVKDYLFPEEFQEFKPNVLEDALKYGS